jgi:hypothetical protein
VRDARDFLLAVLVYIISGLARVHAGQPTHGVAEAKDDGLKALVRAHGRGRIVVFGLGVCDM